MAVACEWHILAGFWHAGCHCKKQIYREELRKGFVEVYADSWAMQCSVVWERVVEICGSCW